MCSRCKYSVLKESLADVKVPYVDNDQISTVTLGECGNCGGQPDLTSLTFAERDALR